MTMNRSGRLIDSHGRILRDLRVSVTDRCNFRCLYCLPETEAAHQFYRGRWANLPESKPIARQWAPRAQILRFEEIERLVRLFVRLGIEKVRLTGGEPLLRQELEHLVARLSRIEGLRDLALTSNGFLFPQKAAALHAAGLRRISFSLDSLQPANFRKITGRDGLSGVLSAITLARQLGLHPVKVNAVIIRDLNDHEIEDLAAFGHAEDLALRFIEFMPLDSGRTWLRDLVVPGREILARLQARFDLRPLAPSHPAETARRWAFPDGRGEIGIIAPVSEPFCGHCNRIRLTADGKIRTCLFSVTEHNLRDRLREGASDEDLAALLHTIVAGKEPGHRIGQPDFVQPDRTMSCIGG
ncbi:MAG: hypothetical protein RJA22_2499 [Verrucomicrobiota bacterium]